MAMGEVCLGTLVVLQGKGNESRKFKLSSSRPIEKNLFLSNKVTFPVHVFPIQTVEKAQFLTANGNNFFC